MGVYNIGMFDTIRDELFCPFCGTKQKADDFQTKDTGSMLKSWSLMEIHHLKPSTIIEIYTDCNHCHNWIDLNILVDKYMADSFHKKDTEINEKR